MAKNIHEIEVEIKGKKWEDAIDAAFNTAKLKVNIPGFRKGKVTKEVFINEPNTIPGSLAFYLWEPVGKGYKELLNDMINIAINKIGE